MATVKSLRIMLYADHKKLSKGLDGAKKKVKNAVRDMAKALATGFAAREIGRTVVSGIREAIKMETFAVDFKVLGTGGSDLLKQFEKDAQKVDFPIDQWMKGGLKLWKADEGQLLEFMESSIAVQKALQTELGVTAQELKKMRMAGEVTANDVRAAMSNIIIPADQFTKDGTKLFRQLRDEAMKSPFPIEDWMLGGKRLLGAQVPAERVVEIMRMLGEMSAGTGSKIAELGLVFTQIFAKGRLQGEEMLQFMERNVSLNKALQKVLKVNKEELQKMQEAGQITPEDVIRAMKEMTQEGGIFGGMMAAKMQTLGGLVQWLSNQWTWVTAEVGSRLIPALAVGAELLGSMIAHGKIIKGFFAAIATAINLVVVALEMVLGVLHFIDVMTLNLFGWIVGIVAGWGAIAYSIYLANASVAALTGGTTLFAIISQGVRAIWTGIAAAVTTATGGMNMLLAAAIALGTALFWWVSSNWLTRSTDNFEKMRQDAEEINRNMKAATTQKATKLFIFGTAELANFTARQRNKQLALAEKQVQELQRIRENTAKEKEKEFKQQKTAQTFSKSIVFSP